MLSPSPSPEKVVKRVKSSAPKTSQTTTIRFKDGELDLLKKTARLHGMRVSSFVRSAIILSLGVASREEAVRLDFDAHLAQMRGVGTNLNQLAKMAHLGQVAWDDTDRKLVSELLVSVRQSASLFQTYLKQSRARDIRDPEAFDVEFGEMLALFNELESGDEAILDGSPE